MASNRSEPPVLVTGGFGAIGSFVVRRLLDDRRRVVVYSRNANHALVPDLREHITHAPGDVQDRERLASVVAEFGVKRIIHLAAALGSALERDPPLGYRVNVLGGLNIFEVARDQQLERVVFASSKANYGALAGDYGPPTFRPVTEDYVGQTSNVYGANKKALEDAAFHYRRLFGLDLIALRLGSTYGPGKGGSAHAGYPGLKAYIVASALKGEPFEVPMPDVVDDIVYNRDVAKGAVLACFAPQTEHWQFNIAGGQLSSVRQYVEEVMRVVPEHRLSIASTTDASAIARNVTGLLSIDRARTELGYEPDFPAMAGVSDYVAMLRMQQATTTSVR
jgi:nucleoside-diphosphate-sugar epimerase